MTSRLKIAYLTANDPADRRSWSGTQYYMAQALQKHCGDVTPIGPLRPKSLLFRKAARKALRLVGKEYLFTHTKSFAEQTARIAEQRLAGHTFDLIFAPAGSGQIAYLRTDLPIVYLSDTTFAAILNYYPEFSRVSKSIIPQANALEQLAIDKANLVLYSSSWAAESARRDYHAAPEKLHVVPFGANLDDPPAAETILSKVPSDVCRLLFVGVDWTKKGGEIAFETLLELQRLGVRAQLTIIGCTPPRHVTHRNLRVFPFLNKNDFGERRQLRDQYHDSDIFLLPTRADCSPIVLCEANAFGLPAISTDTGGWTSSETARTAGCFR